MSYLVQDFASFKRVFEAVSLVAGALWVGALLATSWLCSRARWMADGAEIGGLAVMLHRGWATRCLVLSVACGLLASTGASDEALRRGTAPGAMLALAVLLWVHARIGRRAAGIARGSSGALPGEAAHQLTLILSLAALAALVTFHSVVVP